MDTTLKMEPSCMICAVKFENGSVVSATPCCHFFHKKCLKVFLKLLHSCPECKMYITPKDITKFSFNSNMQVDLSCFVFEEEIRKLKADINMQKKKFERIDSGTSLITQYIAGEEPDTNQHQASNFPFELETELSENIKSVFTGKSKTKRKQKKLLLEGLERLKEVKRLICSIEADVEEVSEICLMNIEAAAAAQEIINSPIFNEQQRNLFFGNRTRNESNVHERCSDTCQMDLSDWKLKFPDFEEQILNLKKENAAVEEENFDDIFDFSLLNINPPSSVQFNSSGQNLDIPEFNADMKCKVDPEEKKGKSSVVKSTSTRKNKSVLCSRRRAANKNSAKKNTPQ